METADDERSVSPGVSVSADDVARDGVRIAGVCEGFASHESSSLSVQILLESFPSQKAEPNNFEVTNLTSNTSETTTMQLASSFPPLFSFLPEHQRVVHLWFLVLTTIVATFLVWLFHWPAKKVKLHPMRASPFRPESVPKNIDTIVIGACKRMRTSIEILVRYQRFGILDECLLIFFLFFLVRPVSFRLGVGWNRLRESLGPVGSTCFDLGTAHANGRLHPQFPRGRV